jgi:hypothetical protein
LRSVATTCNFIHVYKNSWRRRSALKALVQD